jgi:5-methyltetrahydropteroyltriglutamate--homocysteine methyltransferase
MAFRSSGQRILTTHVGSLIRPDALRAFVKAKLYREPYDEKTYEACLSASIAAVVKAQADIGLDIINDGEFGRWQWNRYATERFSGVELRKSKPTDVRLQTTGKDRAEFPDFYKDYDRALTSTLVAVVTGPVAYKAQQEMAGDVARMKQAMKAVPCQGFITAVAPASVAPDMGDDYYKDREKLLFAMADALHEEYRQIIDAGFILQVDDCYMAAMGERIDDPRDYRKWVDLCVDSANHALRGIPEEKARYHLCWGSWNGPHVHDVPLKDIVDAMARVRVGGYLIESANPRHEHEWRIWETVKLPEGRKLIPGLISHATNIVEHPELVCERITRLAKLVGRENLIASTDCGFAQNALSERVHVSIMWAKLRALVEGAKMATAELWGHSAMRTAS